MRSQGIGRERRRQHLTDVPVIGGFVDLTHPEPRLVLDRQESGVPAHAARAEKSRLGTQLLEWVLTYELDAEAHRSFEPGGIHCIIDLHLALISRQQRT